MLRRWLVAGLLAAALLAAAGAAEAKREAEGGGKPDRDSGKGPDQSPAERHKEKEERERRALEEKHAREREEARNDPAEAEAPAPEPEEERLAEIEERQAEEARAFEEEKRKEREAFRAELHAREGRRAKEARETALGTLGDRLGGFADVDEWVRGTFVSFRLDRAGGWITNVTVLGEPVLDRVRAGPEPEIRVRGATLTVSGAQAEVRIVDAPALSLRVRATENATFDLADHWNLTARGAASSAGTRAVLGGAYEVADGFTVKVNASRQATLVLAGPAPGGLDADALAPVRGRADAEVAWEDAGVQAVPLGDLDVVAEPSGAGLRVVVDGEGEGGRVVALRLPASVGDGIEVRYFDELPGGLVEVPIRPAEGGLDDALDPDDDSTPEWWVGENENGTVAIVTVPTLSVHVIDVTPLGALARPSVALGLLAGAAATVGAGALLLAPRRR